MAVSPEILEKAFGRRLNELEKIVDRKLTLYVESTNLSANGYLAINLDGTDLSLFSILIPKYVAVGWREVSLNTGNRYAYFYYDLSKFNFNTTVVTEPETILNDKRKITL